MDKNMLEKYSSAITLSDMEIFVFPELMYSLVLANIMSPLIWRWREKNCFKKLEGKTPYRRLMRMKQYIMDEYEFNLDLETWGLTNRNTELKRFEKFIPPEQITKSNALFGYQGDKYYFDVDIRRHFGLDKYDSDIIPYWKTETVEAMDAFRFKDNYGNGAGECVSLSSLYAAAAFIICGIPLEDIFMLLTPLHSQNFIDLQGGILTNNRRLVTKTMWFNGTAITEKAQRALRNEQVTIVAHNSGYVHCLYDKATIAPDAYQRLRKKLGGYLTEKLTTLTLANFLRVNGRYQKYFQFCCHGCRGGDKFVKAEVLFHYEHGSRYRIEDKTFEKLIAEISDEDLMPAKHSHRLCCRQFYNFLQYENLDVRNKKHWQAILKYITPFVPQAEDFLTDLADFLHAEAKLPSSQKTFSTNQAIELSVDMDRDDIIDYLQSIRSQNTTADLAFYAYRDMTSCRWEPFVKAAVERSPVSIEKTKDMSIQQVYQWLGQMPDTSFYYGQRLAQPDEVANYMMADGLEKAFLMANIIRNRQPDKKVEIISRNGDVEVKPGGYKFMSCKDLSKCIKINPDGKIENNYL